MTARRSGRNEKADSSHSFILKIWGEDAPEPGRSPNWRGRITHVKEGRYGYVKNLNELIRFLVPYFKEMGVQIQEEGNLTVNKVRSGKGKGI